MGLYLGALIKGGDIAPGEAHLMTYVNLYGPCPIAELVRVFGYKKPTMTSMLDRLAAKKLITRTVNPEDRRSFLVAATARGSKAAVAARIPAEELDVAVRARVSDRDYQGFVRVLDALAAVTGVDVRGGDKK
jgi:DNA-binding MarR family transcriptional regulator